LLHFISPYDTSPDSIDKDSNESGKNPRCDGLVTKAFSVFLISLIFEKYGSSDKV